jgi:hypothetical protein
MKTNENTGISRLFGSRIASQNGTKHPKKRGSSNRVMLMRLILLATIFGPAYAQAADHFVRQGATGSGNGNDWTNAYTSLPSTLIRGDTYYIADGTYGSYTFDDPVSGSSIIYIKKATIGSHGTDTGWSNTYGDGQATFGNYLAFFSSNWVFDGVSGTDYLPGHGFRVDNSANSGTTLILFGQPGGAGVSNITVSHIDLLGRGYNQTAVNDRGFYSNSSNASNYTISHNFISGVGVPFLTRQVNTMLVEYNHIEGNHSQPESHGEPWSDTGTDNVIFRYNRLKNPEGTAVFFIGNGGAGNPTNSNTSSNWQLYGNIFYYQNYAAGSGHNPGTGAVLWCPSSAYGGDTYCHNWMIYNNTFYNFSYGSSSGRILARTGTGITTPLVQGNIWDSSSDSAYHENVTASYNYYRNTAHNTESNEQIGSSSPFVSAANADFHLSGVTSGVATISPLAGLTVNATDMAGVVRGGDGVWDRGAFEYSTLAPSNTLSLSPPTNLRLQ